MLFRLSVTSETDVVLPEKLCTSGVLFSHERGAIGSWSSLDPEPRRRSEDVS
jgi:hypothetical protein